MKASAGSGKTYTAIALAVRALRDKQVRRVILTRPAVEAGEKLGFLPGDLKDKLDPYLQPLYDAPNDMIPPAKLQKFMEDHKDIRTIYLCLDNDDAGERTANVYIIIKHICNTYICTTASRNYSFFNCSSSCTKRIFNP